MDGDTVPLPGTATGFVSGNETSYNFTDDDVIYSEMEVSRPTSGW